MKLEDICVSFEYAKKLKEIGIKQNSLFSFFNRELSDAPFYGEPSKNILLSLEISTHHKYNNYNKYAAFTASELLNMLPYEVHFNNYKDYREFALEIIKTDEHIYKIQYFNAIHESAVIICGGILSILSNMIIYIIENKLVSVEEINERI